MMAVLAALPFCRAESIATSPAGRVQAPRRRLVLLGEGSTTPAAARRRRWPAILGAVGYLAFDITALIIAFAAFGGAPPLGPLIFAYVIGQLGGLIPLPAGIGGTDGGMIGAMVLYGSSLSTGHRRGARLPRLPGRRSRDPGHDRLRATSQHVPPFR